jgi:hypothetical protein
MTLTHSERQKKWILNNPNYAKAYRDSHKLEQHKVQKEWRLRNKERNSARVRKSQRKKVLWINSLKDKPCADCGGNFPPYVMHFDHRDPSKKFLSVSQMRCHAYKMIKEEIAKCDLICANCHAIRTYFAIHSGTVRIFGGIKCRS